MTNLEQFLQEEPPPRADPDGDRLGQDDRRHHGHLPAHQVRRRAPRALPGGPQQPRRAGREGVPGLPRPRQPPALHRAVQRPAPLLEHHHGLEPRRHLDDPAGLLDAQGRARARPHAGRRLAVRDRRRRPEGAAAGGLQRRLPARVLRRGGDRRGAPLDLHPVAAGGGVLRRLPRRPHGHAEQADARLLQQEPRHGVRPRARRGRRRQRGLRGLQHPHEDHRAGRHGRSAPRHDARLPRPPDPRAALGVARRGPLLRPERAGPPRRGEGPDPHHHPHVPRPAAGGHLPRPQGGPEDADLRQGRQPRRGHRRDRARRVRSRQRLLPEDHLQGHRPRTRAT